jgi:hypothetical protein
MNEKTEILVYKRDHFGDPNNDGVFGCHDCMGVVRDWPFTAVIGIGGIGDQVHPDIRGRISWIGVGVHRRAVPAKYDYRGPLILFDHFLNCNASEIMVCDEAPNLATRMYDTNVRATMSFNRATQREIQRLLGWANDADPSSVLQLTASQILRRCHSTC